MKISSKVLIAAALAGAISARPMLAAADGTEKPAPAGATAEKASCSGKEGCSGKDKAK